MTWELNELYESEEDEMKDATQNILPSWLRLRPEMIYPQSSIQQTDKLGQGQFGSVYRGKLTQGNAVYVKPCTT